MLGTERHESRRIDNQLRGRFGTAGRPGGEPLLPVAHRRPHAAVQLRRRRGADGPQRRAGRPRDRVEGRLPRDPLRAVAGRGAQRRDPQERAQVRRRAEPPARGDLLGPAPHPRGRRHPRAGADLPREGDRGRHRLAHRRGLRRRLGLRRPVGRAEDALPDLDHDRGGARRGGQPRPRQPGLHQARDPLGREARLLPPRGAARLARDARARAPRRAVGHRPALARPPLRDGLPEGRHRPAGDGAARSARRVPARGLLPVPDDDGADPRGDHRVPLQPRGRGEPGRVSVRSSPRSTPVASPTATCRSETLRFTAPTDDGGVEVRNQRGLLERAATARAQIAAAQQASFDDLLGEDGQPVDPSRPARRDPVRRARPVRPQAHRAVRSVSSRVRARRRTARQRRAADRGQ